MTEQEIRQKVVDTAKAWYGFKQSNGSHQAIIDLYNSQQPLPRLYPVKYTDAWCATFVSAVGIKLGLADIILPECSCFQMVNLFKAAGRWEEDDAYVPQIGDIVQYDWGDSGKGDNVGRPDHVGIVCSVSGQVMQIIEGNLNYSVGYRKLMVNARYIRGYCLPDYASKADGKADSKEEPAVSGETYQVQASGEFDTEAAAKDALAKAKELGLTGSVSKKTEATTQSKAIKVGSVVRLNAGAKYYTGQTPASFVYNRDHVVHSMSGNRVVISYKGVIIAAVHKDNLTLVD